MASLEVLSPGSTVKIKEPDIEGRITAVSIRGEKPLLKYEVAWWDGQSRYCSWFENFEVEKTDNRRQTEVGFKTLNS